MRHLLKPPTRSQLLNQVSRQRVAIDTTFSSAQALRVSFSTHTYVAQQSGASINSAGWPSLVGLMTLLGSSLWSITTVAQPVGAPASYEIEAALDGETWRNTQGGMATGNRFLTHGLLSLTVNGESAFGIPGISLYGSTLFTNGQSVNELVGTAQGISNIEAPAALRLFESWVEWLHASGNHSLKFGLYDVNSEFDAIETASLFINPSHGIGPDFSQSGVNGPSIFPTASLGLRSWHQHGPWTVQLAALDGVPGDPTHETRSTIKFGKHDGLLLLAETSVATEGGLRAAAGYWRYTASFDDLQATDANGDAQKRNNNHGYYALVDTRLIASQDNHFGVNAYVRYGQANIHINTIKDYWGAGVVLSSLAQAQDQLGLAVGIATAGRPYREAAATQGLDTTAQERIVELSYFRPVTAWLSVQPDIQYVDHAGFDSQSQSGLAVGIRFELTAALRK